MLPGYLTHILFGSFAIIFPLLAHNPSITSQKMSSYLLLEPRDLFLCSAYEMYWNGLFLSRFAWGADSCSLRQWFSITVTFSSIPTPHYLSLLVLLAAAQPCRRQSDHRVPPQGQGYPQSRGHRTAPRVLFMQGRNCTFLSLSHPK